MRQRLESRHRDKITTASLARLPVTETPPRRPDPGATKMIEGKIHDARGVHVDRRRMTPTGGPWCGDPPAMGVPVGEKNHSRHTVRL